MELIEMEKSSRKTIDSNILIGTFLPGDRLRNRAIEVLEELKKENKKIIIHPLVLIETLSILKYKGSIELALKAKKTILSNFETDTKLGSITKRAERMFEKYPKIGMVDSILMDYCLKNRIKLKTLDKAMINVWDKLVS